MRNLKNVRVLVTSGATWVAIDDVRVISNISTGQMGQLIVKAFKSRGADVTLLEGNVSHPYQGKGVKILKFRFFDELAKLLKLELKKKYDIVIHAAAVSDFKLDTVSRSKVNSDQSLVLCLKPTEKLIHWVKKISPQSFLVGFKLETRFMENKIFQDVKSLFVDAGCDLVVANSLHPRYQGFLVNADGDILAKVNSKELVSEKLVKILL